MKLIWLSGLLFLTTPHVLMAKSVEKEFGEAWATREARYAFEVKESQAAVAPALADLASDPNAPADAVTSKTVVLFQRVESLGRAAGHADVISRLRAFMGGKPSAVRADLWLHDQADQLKMEAEKAQQQMAEAQASQGLMPYDKLRQISDALLHIGHARGATDELSAANDNLGTYYGAKREQDDRRRRALAGMLLGLGQELQASSRQSQPWTITCSATGQFTNCTGH